DVVKPNFLHGSSRRATAAPCAVEATDELSPRRRVKSTSTEVLPELRHAASVACSMSTQRGHPPLAGIESWLPGLDRAVATRLLGRALVERAERSDLALDSPPLALANQLLQARIAEPGGGAYEASAGLGQAGELACHCTCAEDPPCVHVAWLL